MTIIHSFLITKLKRKNQVNEFNNVIYEAEYRGYAVAKENESLVYNYSGTVSFDISELNGDAFISFDDVNMDTVMSWILQKEMVSSIEEASFASYAIQSVQAKIDALQESNEVLVNNWHSLTEIT